MDSDAKLPNEAEPAPPAMVPKDSAKEYFSAANEEGDDSGLTLDGIRMTSVSKQHCGFVILFVLGSCGYPVPFRSLCLGSASFTHMLVTASPSSQREL